MAWFKTKEEKQRKKEIESAMSKVRLFPGTKKDYEDMVGYETKTIELGFRDCGVYFRGFNNPECIMTLEFQEKLIKEGIEAIVNHSYSRSDAHLGSETIISYGLPVAKKKKVENGPFRS